MRSIPADPSTHTVCADPPVRARPSISTSCTPVTLSAWLPVPASIVTGPGAAVTTIGAPAAPLAEIRVGG